MPPALHKLIGGRPFVTRFAAAAALSQHLAKAGARASGAPHVLTLPGDVAAALGKKPGSEIHEVELLEAVSAVLEPVEPYVITHEIE